MSVQVAMMAGMAAMSAASAIQQGSAQAGALKNAAGQASMQGLGFEVQSAQTKLQHEQEELKRREGLGQMMAANHAAVSGRGVSAEQGSSYDVIQDYNKAQGDKDVANIRRMGESKSKMLDFSAQQSYAQGNQYMNMAGMAQTNGIFSAIRSIGMAGISYFGLPSGGGATNPAAGHGGVGENYKLGYM